MAVTCDILNGGTPPAPGSTTDTVNGGTPTSVNTSETVNGGQPISPCPPFNDTSPAGYIALLGDGGTGHSVIFHDRKGVPVAELPCRAITDIRWSRELSEVSRCVLSGGVSAAPDVLDRLRPLVHHLTVWRDSEMVWIGVLQAIEGDRDEFDIEAFDYSTFLWRTRSQSTKTWNDTDPTQIMGELWTSMYERHRLSSPPPAVFESTVQYDYQITKDAVRLEKPMKDLVKMGADWTIFRGRPVTLPTVRNKELVSPIMLADCDFAEQLKVRRDGTRFSNDILLRGKNYSASAVREVGELRVQDLVNINDLFGAANVQKAVDQLLARRSAIRIQVKVPSGATLHPTAPVTINELMPGVIFVVHTSLAGGVAVERKLETVDVRQNRRGEEVSVTLGAVPLPPEAGTFEDGGADL